MVINGWQIKKRSQKRTSLFYFYVHPKSEKLFGFADSVHAGSANWASSFCCWLAIFQCDFLWILHFLLFAALHTISLWHFASFRRYFFSKWVITPCATKTTISSPIKRNLRPCSFKTNYIIAIVPVKLKSHFLAYLASKLTIIDWHRQWDSNPRSPG